MEIDETTIVKLSPINQQRKELTRTKEKKFVRKIGDLNSWPQFEISFSSSYLSIWKDSTHVGMFLPGEIGAPKL